MTELDDGAFERAYQRMMLRRNLEFLDGETYGRYVCGAPTSDGGCVARVHSPVDFCARHAPMVPRPRP